MKFYFLPLLNHRKTAFSVPFIMLWLVLWSSSAWANVGFGQHLAQQPISLQAESRTLQEVLKDIERQADVVFVFSSSVPYQQKVSIAVKAEPLDRVLFALLSPLQISYEVVDQQIVLQKRPEEQDQPDGRVSGTVTDQKTGQPVPGVNVLIKGTNHGTVTDIDGNYALEAPDSASTLVFSFIGYRTTEIAIEDRTTVDVALATDTQTLESVVVVGYGTQKKANLTGAVSQIDSETIEDRPTANVTQAIQGAIPNFNINFDDGRPGTQGQLNIRGNTSINGGEPLVLIDGVPGGTINSINPLDVESITVLKDAASAAIYGARAAFGVVLITTKSGKPGKMTVNYSSNYAFSSPTVRTDFLTDGYTVAQLYDEAFMRNSGTRYTGYTDADYEELKKRQTDPTLPSVVIDDRNGRDQYIYYGNTDWYRVIYRDVQPSMQQAISLSGGSDKVDFLLSGRYYQKDGIMKINQDKFRQYNLRVKVNAEVTDWLTVGANIQYNTARYTYPGWGIESNFTRPTFHALPSYVPTNPDGTATYRTGLNNYAIGDGAFPALLHGKSGGEENSYEIVNTLNTTLRLTDHLNVVANYSYIVADSLDYQRRTEEPWSIYPGEIDYVGFDRLSQQAYGGNYQVVNAYANYEQDFGQHALKVTGGVNQEINRYKAISGYRNDLLSEDLHEFSLGTGDQEINSYAREWALLGLFYRVNYNYAGKYLLETNGRYDGTSRFPEGKRFGFFPSVSAGWRISEEDFFTPLKSVINEMKIRASYGSLGNQLTAPYGYIETLRSGELDYLMDGANTEYLTSPNPISPNLTWEKATSANIGVDLGLLENRLTLSLDAYRRTTTDMLTKGKTLPEVFGANEPKENAADLRTEGFEVAINWQNNFSLGGKDFNYSVGFNLADYTAVITRFDNPTKLLDDYYVGQQLGDIWGYTIEGYFKTDQQAAEYTVDQSNVNRQIGIAPGEWGKLRAGDMIFADLNGDGVIDVGQNTLSDHGDLRVVGNDQPRFPFGLNLTANWNGFDVRTFFQGIGKQNWYPGNNAIAFWGPYSRPYASFLPADFIEKVWTPENPDAYFPVLRAYTALTRTGSLRNPTDRYMQDLAYIRLKNVTVGYSLPTALTERLRLSRVRLYLSGENLVTLTKLDTQYIDPEQAPGNNGNGRVYPFSKIYSFGLDVSF